MNTQNTTRELERELLKCVYQWGRVGVVVDELCPTFQRYMDKLKDAHREEFAEEYDICTACGESMADGHYNNNAECDT